MSAFQALMQEHVWHLCGVVRSWWPGGPHVGEGKVQQMRGGGSREGHSSEAVARVLVFVLREGEASRGF